ncbi:hypothetical protein [Nocardia sp. MW-W600-9]
MTVIAAIATDDRVILGCDTRTSYGSTGIMTVGAKIDTLYAPNGDRVLIAASGDAALRTVAVRGLSVGGTPHPNNDAGADRWANTMAEAITDGAAAVTPPVLRPAGDHGAGSLDGSLLLAWRHHLWWIFAHTAVRPHPAIMAIGSGTEVALGSLHTSTKVGVDPVEAVALAVRLACRHADGCGIDERGPIIHSTVDI